MSVPALPRRHMALVGASVFAISVVSHFRTPLLPAIGAELGLAAGRLGLITTTFAAGRLLADLPAGFLVDRLGIRRVFVIAGIALGLGGMAFTMATGAGLVYVAAGLLGMASALANTTGMTYFSTVAGAERRGSAMAVFSASLLGGQAIGPTIGGAIADLGTWRTSMLVAALLGVLLAVLGAASRAFGWFAARRVARPSDTRPDVAIGALGPLQRVALYGIPFSSMFMLGSLPQTLVPIIGGDTLGLSTTTIGLALGMGGVVRMVGAPVGGWLSDRISRKGVLVPALFLQAAGVSLLAVATSVRLWLASIVLLSLFSFSGVVAATVLGDLAGGQRMGRRLGSYRFVGDGGLLIGPAVTGLLYQHVGQAPAVLVVSVLLGVVAVLVAVVLPETRPRSRAR
ncbi:MAG TPA: MFS transporter [Egicoccus sp.]|nr:MFS transporter [Egicoccus sp.]HSK22932.1 MFS transporter [Egicoccus sp.]